MTDTIASVLQYRMGTWSNADGTTMRGVEYLGEYADRHARWDWVGVSSTDDFDAQVKRYAEAYAAGTGAPPTYSKLAHPWEFTPDPDPALPEEIPTTREAQARAINAMRRREAEALERAARAETARDAARAQHADLQERMSTLADRLLEEAQERDWCGEYESFVESNGFEDILHKRAKAGHVHVTIDIRVDVADVEDFEISTLDIRNAIQYGDGWDGEWSEGEVCEE